MSKLGASCTRGLSSLPTQLRGLSSFLANSLPPQMPACVIYFGTGNGLPGPDSQFSADEWLFLERASCCYGKGRNST